MSRKSRSFEAKAISATRAYYERMAYDMLQMLWAHRSLVAVVFGFAFVALSVALVLLPHRYTGEAMIQLDFTRNETVAGEKVQSTAAVDAASVVDSAARIIRSRRTASAVVSVLRLDRDPAYTRLSLPARLLAVVFGAPTPRDLAVARLMRQITVANDTRSYLITVAVTAADPEHAARLANWVASEYLRGRMREQAIEAYAAAEREMNGISAVFGSHHPSYLNAQAKIERLKAELASAWEGAVAEDREAVVARGMVQYAAGQTLFPAEVVMVPSGPNAQLLAVLTILVALAVGVLLSWLDQKGWLRWFIPRLEALTAYGLSQWRSSLQFVRAYFQAVRAHWIFDRMGRVPDIRDLWHERFTMHRRIFGLDEGAERREQSAGSGPESAQHLEKTC
jgi:capsular polysaccharide biosynthesis protein